MSPRLRSTTRGSSGTSGATGVPLRVVTGETFTVPTNTQVVYARDIILEAGANIVTEGTGVLAWVD